MEFPYLRDVWRSNTSAERLLGVSLTGIMDNALMSGQQGMEPLNDTLQQLKAHAVQVRRMGIRGCRWFGSWLVAVCPCCCQAAGM